MAAEQKSVLIIFGLVLLSSLLVCGGAALSGGVVVLPLLMGRSPPSFGVVQVSFGGATCPSSHFLVALLPSSSSSVSEFF